MRFRSLRTFGGVDDLGSFSRYGRSLLASEFVALLYDVRPLTTALFTLFTVGFAVVYTFFATFSRAGRSLDACGVSGVVLAFFRLRIASAYPFRVDDICVY